jgi:hypothetical protein
MVLKKIKNIFLFEFGYWAESLVRPNRPPRVHADCAAQWFTGAHPRKKVESNPLSKSDTIAPDPT